MDDTEVIAVDYDMLLEDNTKQLRYESKRKI
jgi:hypothetical protein